MSVDQGDEMNGPVASDSLISSIHGGSFPVETGAHPSGASHKQPTLDEELKEVEDEDEDDEDEDDEEDDDEDDEDDEEGGRQSKRAKRRHKMSVRNIFVDTMAEDSDNDGEEEEEEEEEEGYGNMFITEGAEDEGDETGSSRRRVGHARLDMEREELDGDQMEQIAIGFQNRVRSSAKGRYTGDMNDVPQRLLMPSVHDASLWQIRVKTGRERDIVFSLMRKAIDLEYTARNISILSAFQRDSLPGMVYIEAKSSAQVSHACQGLVGIYLSRGIALVPIDEMASLLQIKKQDVAITPGMWVRIKRTKYQGDLAQVLDISETGADVGLKLIPRIDMNPRDDMSVDGRKRKKVSTSLNMRPPQRFFNADEVVKAYGRKQMYKRNQVWIFAGDEYKDGFLEKDFKISAVTLENVNPTLDEISRFTSGVDGREAESSLDLSAIAEASRKAAIAVLQPGDHVEVFEGEQSGMHGTVESIAGDVVTLSARGEEFEGQKMDVPARSVRKRFKAGDHVKVMAGQNADETGLVVSVTDNLVTFLSDMSMQEVSVFSKDLREAAEVGSGTNTVGNYELHDLVQLDASTVGVIFKTERDSFRVLDQNGQVRLVQPHQISMRRDSVRAVATDSDGHELRINDNMKEIDGECRKGLVIHIHQSFFAFLYNRDVIENGGVFVTRARSLASQAPKGNTAKALGMDLTKMNPATAGGASGGMVGSGVVGRGPRDRLIGTPVSVVKGFHKGYLGVIKETNGNIIRVELSAGNKVIALEKDKLRRRRPDGALEPLDVFRPFGSMGPPGLFNRGSGTGDPYAAGGRTPATARTPNPYGSRTPAWNASSRTPNPYAEAMGKTPAWNSSSRTPNPYVQDGGRTPAAARTPNPYGASAWGGATPKNSGWGGATPKPTNNWGEFSGDSWDNPSPNPYTNAGTPANAVATPGGQYNTPGNWAYEHATPGLSAPTPASAATPGPSAGLGDLSDESIPDDWLSLPMLRGKKVVVQVSGTRGPNGWYDGQWEDHKGSVINFSSGAENFSAMATVEWLDIVGETLPVPAHYLRPVHPETKQDSAIVLVKGKHLGKQVRIRETDGPLWTVSDADLEVFACSSQQMVKLRA